jgi:hypothetical protein
MDTQVFEQQKTQLGMPGLQLAATGSVSDVRLSKHKILELWENGILPDVAFVYLALQCTEKEMEGMTLDRLDIENFCFNWRGAGDGSGKVKELTKKRLLNAVTTLEQKGYLTLHNSQLSLDLG